MKNTNNVHFPDDSAQAHAIRARLANGDHAFVHDTGNGFTVADPPTTTSSALTAGTYFQVTGAETRSAAVLSSWPVVPYDPMPDPNRPVEIFNQFGLVHAPQPLPATAPARKTLVSSSFRGDFGLVQARFVVEPGEHIAEQELSNWNLCWLQVGETWRGHVLAYVNYYPKKQWLRLSTNFGHAASSIVHRDVRGVELHAVEPYIVDVEYVAGSYAQVVISAFDRAETIATVRETRLIAPTVTVDGDWRLSLGHERAEKDVKLEPGWGYKWRNVELHATAHATASFGVALRKGGSHG
jgi:hypothetical protein